jgi:hypothetical protein
MLVEILPVMNGCLVGARSLAIPVEVEAERTERTRRVINREAPVQEATRAVCLAIRFCAVAQGASYVLQLCPLVEDRRLPCGFRSDSSAARFLIRASRS